ncbi:hypothetical protein KIH39_12645 [Telmatocola sphagniphila]|uniref:Uncharacterized protein n=1 Tax=Telmatocola sphagniphila TaxID=1123043 RepID=A0A8E6BBJ4_9BACT|nr:hypothetical protein [Telmatocola sphagniphila]QVL34716.1 hypothetical protein KIH39_12645 [Telmatocola sphagniphila]
MRIRHWVAASLLSVAGFSTGNALIAGENNPEFTFSRLKSSTPENARKNVEAWLKNMPGVDGAAVDKIWSNNDLSVLDRTVETFKLADPRVAKLLEEAKLSDKNPPKQVPDLLKDTKLSPFFRANLSLAYAKALCSTRVYEEALEVLRGVTPEQVVDPASYFFHRAVAEHATIKRDEAVKSIVRLVDDVTDAPDRYKMLASIMFVDIQGWKREEKDLSNIARLMDNVERRLELSRGGEKTQDIQKKIVFRLDELIKEKENQCKGNCNGSCPNGGKPGEKPGSGQGPNPMQDSFGGTNGGQGTVDEKKLKALQENWVKMPEKERAKAMMDLTKDLPPKYRVVIEEYFKSLARSQP